MEEIEKGLQKLPTPTPEVIDEFMTQMLGTCQGNLTTDFQFTMQNMSSCVNNLFNKTEAEVMAEMRDAITTTGNFGLIFQDLCHKWPRMKDCMKGLFLTMGECWGENSRDQILQGVDLGRQFFCGAEKGERIPCSGILCFFNRLNI